MSIMLVKIDIAYCFHNWRMLQSLSEISNMFYQYIHRECVSVIYNSPLV